MELDCNITECAEYSDSKSILCRDCIHNKNAIDPIKDHAHGCYEVWLEEPYMDFDDSCETN
jgi:hypothetical protein